jgi:RND family efflux transporter MFP subunit
MTSSPRRSWLVGILCGLVVLLAAGGVFAAIFFLGGGSSAAPPEEQPPAAPVKWQEAQVMSVAEWVELFGTTQPLPDHVARVTAPVEGRVVSVLQNANGKVTEGQLVKKGDLIVQLDATVAQANRDKVAAGLDELKQATKQAELAVQLAEIDVKRLAELNKSYSSQDQLPLVSRIEMDKAKLALQDAEAKAKAASLREIGGRKELDALEKQLALFSLTAPLDGRLGRLLVVPGQTLAVGTAVTDIIDIEEEIDVLCFAPPHVAKRLRDGLQQVRKDQAEGTDDGSLLMACAVSLKDLQNTVREPNGRVQFVAEQAEADTGNFAVKIRIANKASHLLANTTLRLWVQITKDKPCWTLPDSAVFEDQDPPTVIVVEDYKVEKDAAGKEVEKGVARKLQVKLGIHDPALQRVEILSLTDPEKKWKGVFSTDITADNPTKFVVERGRGLRTDDPIRKEVDED